MFNHIENIRQKPEYVRRRIALFITLTLFFVVVFIWILTLDTSPVRQEKSRIVDEAPSPFWTLRDTLNNSANDMSSKFEELKKQFNGGNEGQNVIKLK